MEPPTRDRWTTAHDLSLLYIALAYGTDHDLTDEELSTIVDRLHDWDRAEAGEETQEMVMEAMAIYLEEDAGREVAGSIDALSDALSDEERRRVLDDLVRIGEADGVLLSSEQNLIAALADAWHLRRAARERIDQTTAEVEAFDAWSLLHDLGLLYVVLAHSTDAELTDAEIGVILELMGAWQPDLTEEAAREVLREVLSFYASQPSEEALEASVRSVREALPPVQRLILLDDLDHIAHTGGNYNEYKQDMIASLAEAWDASVRFDSGTHANAESDSDSGTGR